MFVQRSSNYISPKKLIARVKSNLRRTVETADSLESDGIIKIGNLIIDRSQFKVYVDGNELILPKKEFEVLVFLARSPGKVFSRESILRDVWGSNIYVVERTIDVHIRKIREKLDKFADMIETVKGVGYRFKSVE